MAGDGVDCGENYNWELDEAFRPTGNEEIDENLRLNILRGIGIPVRTVQHEEDESTDSESGDIFDRKINVLPHPENGFACEKDLGWFDIVQSPSPWDEARRPYDQLLIYEDLELTKEEMEGNLSGMIMATGLNMLDSVPMTDGFALTKLQLANRGLKNIQILDAYKFIQYVDISHNAIKDLSPLDGLTYLIVLDASHNEVERFAPSPTPWFLSFLNLSYNKFTEVLDVSSMWSLKHLNLSNNLIERIRAVKDLDYLEYLNLSHNTIGVLENISKVPLKTLDMSWNRITHCEEIDGDDGGLRNISTLQRLDLSHNLISTMEDMKCINPSRLRHLNIAYNNFDDVTSFDDLERYKSLRYLRLEGNAIVNTLPAMVKNIMHMLPQVAYINGRKLTKSERLAVFSAWNFHPLVKEMRKYCYELLYNNVEPPEYGVETVAHLDYDVPIVIVTGPMGTRKYTFVKYIADKYPEYIRRPVIHSTLHEYSEDNPDVCEEFKNININHVEESEFNRMWNAGEFVYVHNDMGDLYGLCRSELEDDGRLVLMAAPIRPALSMKWQGLNTTMLLVKPESEEEYADLLQRMIVSKTKINRERDEAKQMEATHGDARSKASSYASVARVDEEEEEDNRENSVSPISSTSKRSLKRKSDPTHGSSSVLAKKEDESTSTLNISVVELKNPPKTHHTSFGTGERDNSEFRITIDMPWWCSDESLAEVETEELEIEKKTPYIDTLKTYAGEKDKLWTLYNNYYSEAKFYYEEINESCDHLFSRIVVLGDLDQAMKKILPLLVDKYNLSLRPPPDEKKDPLYDVLVEPRLNEMMEILADRGVLNRFETDGPPTTWDAMSSEPSKDTLSMPFFSAETSSFEVTPSTSLTEFGSEERKLAEPQHVCDPSIAQTPPGTPSGVLECMAREATARAGFVPRARDQAIKYSHSRQS